MRGLWQIIHAFGNINKLENDFIHNLYNNTDLSDAEKLYFFENFTYNAMTINKLTQQLGLALDTRLAQNSIQTLLTRGDLAKAGYPQLAFELAVAKRLQDNGNIAINPITLEPNIAPEVLRELRAQAFQELVIHEGPQNQGIPDPMDTVLSDEIFNLLPLMAKSPEAYIYPLGDSLIRKFAIDHTNVLRESLDQLQIGGPFRAMPEAVQGLSLPVIDFPPQEHLLRPGFLTDGLSWPRNYLHCVFQKEKHESDSDEDLTMEEANALNPYSARQLQAEGIEFESPLFKKNDECINNQYTTDFKVSLDEKDQYFSLNGLTSMVQDWLPPANFWALGLGVVGAATQSIFSVHDIGNLVMLANDLTFTMPEHLRLPIEVSAKIALQSCLRGNPLTVAAKAGFGIFIIPELQFAANSVLSEEVRESFRTIRGEMVSQIKETFNPNADGNCIIIQNPQDERLKALDNARELGTRNARLAAKQMFGKATFPLRAEELSSGLELPGPSPFLTPRVDFEAQDDLLQGIMVSRRDF